MTDIVHGVCGANAFWSLDDSGMLVIDGTGELYNNHSSSPWHRYHNSIRRVLIMNGITNIPDFAFFIVGIWFK